MLKIKVFMSFSCRNNNSSLEPQVVFNCLRRGGWIQKSGFKSWPQRWLLASEFRLQLLNPVMVQEYGRYFPDAHLLSARRTKSVTWAEVGQIPSPILEAFDLITETSGQKMRYQYMDENRRGDHICYISDLSKMKAHYPKWGIIKNIKTMFEEISQSWLERSRNRSA